MSDDEQKPAPKKRHPAIGPFAIVVADIWENPKICKAGPDAALVYIYALTRNAKHGRAGAVPLSALEPWYLARQLGFDEQRAAKAVSACVSARLLSLDEAEGNAFIVGWSEDFKRGDLTEYERERKARWRAEEAAKRAEKAAIAGDEISAPAKSGSSKKDKQRDTKSKTHTQTQSVRDKSRTGPGQGVCDAPLDPPMSAAEKADAEAVIDVLHIYTDADWVSQLEREAVVRRLREGRKPWMLMALFAYSADDDGLGWLNKADSSGLHTFRGHLNPIQLLSDIHIARHITNALSIGAWLAHPDALDRIKKAKEQAA